jgi:alginate O-acetyltransferase complex protein AlgI
MSFQSVEYAIFLGFVFLAYNLISRRIRWIVLLVASLGFYANLGNSNALFALIWIILISYSSARFVHECSIPWKRSFLFWTAVVVSLFPLIVLRYASFISGTASPVSWLSFLKAGSEIGISFYTFQALSYLADVHMGLIAPEKQLGYFVLYLSFFPKLLQGPIERAESLLPQLRQCHGFDYDNSRTGLLLIACGLFKKAVIADHLGRFVTAAFDHPQLYSGPSLIIATYMYAAQIYCDFSGYTDIAMGSSLLFNIQIGPNFSSPYLSDSIVTFWRRWHISLSKWLLDYLFKPLQVTLRDFGWLANPLALMITFTICGLWHGPTLNFLVWGALHGVYMVISQSTKSLRRKIASCLRLSHAPTLHKWLQRVICFNLVCVGWIIFRSANLSDALLILKKTISGFAFSHYSYGLHFDIRNDLLFGQTGTDLLISAFGIGVLFFVKSIARYGDLRMLLFERPTWLRWCIYCLMILSITILGTFDNPQFIYFRF